MPQYNEINWEKAACKDSVYTDIFYNVEEERSIIAYEYINALRTTKLTYAMEHEDYGVWGGMTSIERYSFHNPKKYPNQQRRALFAFEEVGISLNEIMECVTVTKEDL